MADLFDNLITCEWCNLRLGSRMLPAFVFHVNPPADNTITVNGTDFCQYLGSHFTGTVVSSAFYERPPIDSFQNIAITETIDDLKLQITLTQLNPGQWYASTNCGDINISISYSGRNRLLFTANDSTGYGNHTLSPLFGIALGNDFTKICLMHIDGIGNLGFGYEVNPGRVVVDDVPISTIIGTTPNIYASGRNYTLIPDTTLFYDMSAYVEIIADDPYENGVGPSEPGGYGDGTFDFSSTPIDFQGLPGIGAMDTGMVSLYVPSASDLRGLAQYLWAGAFDVENFKKLVADPMDTIIGMHIVPLTAAQIGTTASTLVVGNISTGLSMPKATAQYVAIDCGSITIDRKWGAYLDYSPYSKLQLFLPYIGFVDISPDDCMGGTIAVRYSIDILGGTCVAQVKCNDHVLYELSGNCSCEVPVTAGQYQNIALSLTRGIGAIAGGIASGNYAGSVEGVANAALSAVKPEVQRSGGFGGSSGLMGHQIPFLILTVPRLCVPGSQNTYIGYPSFITRTMGELEGYNSVEVTHLEGMSCTQAEADMIIAALAEGVIF